MDRTAELENMIKSMLMVMTETSEGAFPTKQIMDKAKKLVGWEDNEQVLITDINGSCIDTYMTQNKKSYNRIIKAKEKQK